MPHTGAGRLSECYADLHPNVQCLRHSRIMIQERCVSLLQHLARTTAGAEVELNQRLCLKER
jgi:hypothetical protein